MRILVPTKKVPISEVREEQSPRRSPEGERAASSLEKEKPKEGEEDKKEDEKLKTEEKSRGLLKVLDSFASFTERAGYLVNHCTEQDKQDYSTSKAQ